MSGNELTRCTFHLAVADRKFPGKHMYCKKHNYGPMDKWYDCQQCCDETVVEFEAHKASDEYKEGERLVITSLALTSREQQLAQAALGKQMLICPSRRKILRYFKMSTILKKIPPEAATAWIEHFVICQQRM